MKRDFSGIDPDTSKRYLPSKVVKILGLKAVNDLLELEIYCKEAIEKNPKHVETYKAGKTKIIGLFIKQVMDKTKNGANPKMTTEILKKLLEAT